MLGWQKRKRNSKRSQTNNSKNILIAPLNWGIGHASRCVPIIEHAIKKGFNVHIGSDGTALTYLKARYHQLTFHELPALNIEYPSGGSMSIKIAQQIPKIVKAIGKESAVTQSIIEKHEIDFIISDNRYGVYSDRIPSAFVCHQINIQSPFLKGLLLEVHKKKIEKFDICAVPDFKSQPNLSGNLSASAGKLKIPSKFIGPLSRFSHNELDNVEPKFEFTAIISGPEPQRSLFFDLCLKAFSKVNAPCNILAGDPAKFGEIETKENVTIYSDIDDKTFKSCVLQSKNIICRSGYSTIMDLMALNKRAILVPTPGQTEQEYLAKHLKDNFNFEVLNQGEISADRISDFEPSSFTNEVDNNSTGLAELFDFLESKRK